jgi:sorting nexin-25
MEFMDRRSRSLLVQFWLTVESFKDPLESVDSDSSGDEDDVALQPSAASSQTLKEDISMVHDLYFAGNPISPALSAISPKYIQTIRSFAIQTAHPTASEERKVRRSVMLAQRQVEQDMEQDCTEFQRSDLWFRVVGDVSANARKASSTPAAAVTATKVHAPIVRRPLPENPSESFSSSSTFGMLFGSSTPGPSSSAISPTSPSASGYFSRPSQSKLELLMSPTLSTSSESRTPLFDDPNEEKVLAPDEAQVERMEAIQAALTDIIALDKDIPDDARSVNSAGRRSRNASESYLLPPRSPKGSKRRVLFDDETNVDAHSPHENEELEQSTFQLAAPGDLQLSREISRLTLKIESLTAQDRMLDTLIQKAELTGDDHELRLLRQSRAAYSRELRELSFQKSQYEQQEAANRLVAERTRVAIVNAATAEESGKSVVRYLIEVQQLAQDGTFASGWVVARRYNEFLAMHTRLKDKHALVRNLEFPGKRLVTALSGNFVDTRRTSLEKYLQVWTFLIAVYQHQLNCE